MVTKPRPIVKTTKITTYLTTRFEIDSCIFWNHGEETSRKPLYTLHQPKKSSLGKIQGNPVELHKVHFFFFRFVRQGERATNWACPFLFSPSLQQPPKWVLSKTELCFLNWTVWTRRPKNTSLQVRSAVHLAIVILFELQSIGNVLLLTLYMSTYATLDAISSDDGEWK